MQRNVQEQVGVRFCLKVLIKVQIWGESDAKWIPTAIKNHYCYCYENEKKKIKRFLTSHATATMIRSALLFGQSTGLFAELVSPVSSLVFLQKSYLDASLHVQKRFCSSVGLSIRPSICESFMLLQKLLGLGLILLDQTCLFFVFYSWMSNSIFFLH